MAANVTTTEPDPAGGEGAPFAIPPTLLERLRHATRRYLPPSDVALIDRVADFAAATARDEDQVSDIITVGMILSDMHVDATGVTAGMLQHIALDPVSHAMNLGLIPRLNEAFGMDVVTLIESIARFKVIEAQRRGRHTAQPRKREGTEEARNAQLEKVRKMFIAMGDDPRIVVFMLADHLLQMRRRALPADEMMLVAEESRDIFAPLAARLGMSRLEAELDDLAFAQLQPMEYRRVANLVEQVRREQRDYIERVCAVITAEAASIGIQAEASGRYKHLWSIYRKLQRNGWDIHQVYDLIAFRVIVPTVENCYMMLGQIHSIWQPKEDRIKDFISRRKPNGYQSLHTTVFCLDKRLAEIQIRTSDMHQNAEYGAAIHWYYKDIGDTAQLDKHLAPWLKQINEWQSDLQHVTGEEEGNSESAEGMGTRAQIFVFTPHGDVKDLPDGATPVDFAYRIHTNLGDRCSGARIVTPGATVTRRMVPLDYRLESGQIVEIITRKDAHPTRDWLKFVRTHAARTHINRYLKQHERDIYVDIGRDRLLAEMRHAGVTNPENIAEDVLRIVAEQLGKDSSEAMLADIGGDALRPWVVAQALQHYLKSQAPAAPEEVKTPPPTVTHAFSESEAVLDLAGVGGLLAKLANCCHPLPGDPILGYISRGRGIVIHHTRCRSLLRLLEHEPERTVQVAWPQIRLTRYEAPLIVFANDRTGLVRDVTHQIQEMKSNMQSFSSVTNRRGMATMTLLLQVVIIEPKKRDDDTVISHEEIVHQQVEDAIRRIRSVKDVIDVRRDLRALADEEGTP